MTTSEKTSVIVEPLRESIIKMVLSKSNGPFVVVEVGTARNTAGCARYSDGWSTYWWAEAVHKRGGVVVSIDINEQSIEESKKIVPLEWSKDVQWMLGNGSELLLGIARKYVSNWIDVLYLDGSDDPEEALVQFYSAFQMLKPGSTVLIDDTQKMGEQDEGKGTAVLSLARLGKFGTFNIEHFQGRFYRMSAFRIGVPE